MIKHNGKLFRGNCLETIEKVNDRSIQCVVTSPPYWKLRAYDLSEEEVEGEFGQESSPERYVENLVLLFDKIKPKLRNDGTVWLNLGDCYNDPGGAGNDFDPGGPRSGSQEAKFTESRKAPGLKQRDLVGIPWLTAFAMREAGWYLRSDIIWSKTSFMPNSVSNRPMSSHEHIFLFTKSKKYYYDQYSILTPRGTFPRDVWRMGNKKEKNLKHFATFPLELPVRCIKAGTSEHGCCARCGAPYKRRLKIIRSKRNLQERRDFDEMAKKKRGIGIHHAAINPPTTRDPVNYRETIGWKKTCKCKTKKVKPCRVLDPFMGSGSTAVAAERLHRRWVGLELYKVNCRTIRDRVQAELAGADYMPPERRAAIKKIGFGLSKKT